MLAAILEDLRQSEYFHVLINPLPVYGLAIGTLGLLVALAMRSGAARTVALAMVLASALSAWPAFHYGERGYYRVRQMADADGEQWLEAHKQRAEKFIYIFYAAAAAAVLALVLPRKWPVCASPLAITTLLLAVASIAAGAYIAHAGGKIRHREFRNEPAPKIESRAAESTGG